MASSLGQSKHSNDNAHLLFSYHGIWNFTQPFVISSILILFKKLTQHPYLGILFCQEVNERKTSMWSCACHLLGQTKSFYLTKCTVNKENSSRECQKNITHGKDMTTAFFEVISASEIKPKIRGHAPSCGHGTRHPLACVRQSHSQSCISMF